MAPKKLGSRLKPLPAALSSHDVGYLHATTTTITTTTPPPHHQREPGFLQGGAVAFGELQVHASCDIPAHVVCNFLSLP